MKKKKASLEKVQALVDKYYCMAHTQEAIDKFDELVIAPHGMYDGPDEIVVMGYFDFIEGYELDDANEPTDKPSHDFSMEKLGFALTKLGVKVVGEASLELDEATGKLVL